MAKKSTRSSGGKSKRQSGGTFVGIIIGLLVGLAIALGVALVITKTPVPFTNKFARTERSPEATANESVDPNKGLYGNRAASKEAAKQAAKTPEVAPPPPNQVTEKKPEPPKTDEKVAAIKLFSGDRPAKPDAKVSDAKTAPAENAEEKWSYFLQAGAFREQTDAENTRAKLALMGVEARVTERQSENGTLYRVRVGPFSQLDAMNNVRGKLSDNGVDAAVVRISK
jgi:cell division protein FtsN